MDEKQTSSFLNLPKNKEKYKKLKEQIEKERAQLGEWIGVVQKKKIK